MPGGFPMPEADILLHTGDFTDGGLPEEFADFDDWLGGLLRSGRYRHVVVVLGNHEWMPLRDDYGAAKRSGLLGRALQPDAARGLLRNAIVLEHESVELMGLRIYGCGWCPWHSHGDPDSVI